MHDVISTKLKQFKDKGNISDLLELDIIPCADFEHINIRQQVYIWCRSTGSEGFTCYQHAMAYILDHFHPGIVTYLAEKVQDARIPSDNFVNLLNSMLCEIDTYTFDYSALLKSDNDNYEIDNEQMFKAINELEKKISDGGYVMTLGSFHGELYRFSKENNKTMMTLIKQRSPNPIYLWEKGNVEKWYSENINLARAISNTDILEGDVLDQSREIYLLRTKFFGREELKKAFEQTDLREIIDTTLVK